MAFTSAPVASISTFDASFPPMNYLIYPSTVDIEFGDLALGGTPVDSSRDRSWPGMDMFSYPDLPEAFPQTALLHLETLSAATDDMSCFPTKTVPSPISTDSESPSDSDNPVPQTTTRGRTSLQQTQLVRRRGSGSGKAHALVEKRYRCSVNTAIKRLQNAIPQLADQGYSATSRAQTKTAILDSSLKYLRQLEDERKQLQAENNSLRKRERMLFQRLVFPDAAVDIEGGDIFPF